MPGPTNRALYEILVPTVKDAAKGKYYTTRYHKTFDAKVIKISGGLTILTPVKGQWVSVAGELFTERMIPVRIACTEEEINKISDIVASHYNQLAVFFYRISDCVVIKQYPKD